MRAAPPESTTYVARLDCDEANALRLAEALAEAFDHDIPVSAYERAGGCWSVEAYFEQQPDVARLRAALSAATAGSAALSVEAIAARDWVAESLRHLSPVEAGRFVVHGAHDRARVNANRIGVEIEAALAFGTGHHGTTRGCLLALDSLLKAQRPRRVLDVGCGAGALAIASVKALRRPALASDIDAQAVQVARDNARRNGVAAFVTTVHAAGVSARALRAQGPFDLIFANILLPPLQRMAAPLAALTREGGYVILSGLLRAHANAALSAYHAQGLRLAHRIELEGWVTLVMRRPPRARKADPPEATLPA